MQQQLQQQRKAELADGHALLGALEQHFALVMQQHLRQQRKAELADGHALLGALEQHAALEMQQHLRWRRKLSIQLAGLVLVAGSGALLPQRNCTCLCALVMWNVQGTAPICHCACMYALLMQLGQA